MKGKTATPCRPCPGRGASLPAGGGVVDRRGGLSLARVEGLRAPAELPPAQAWKIAA